VYKKIILKKGKERSLLNFHPWIFSGAIQHIENGIEEGDLVNVFSADKKFIACGLYHKSSITVRIISFEETSIDNLFWSNKIAQAVALRKKLNLVANDETNAFRLIHGEGDGLSGLIVDVYNTTAVIQAHNKGIYKMRNEIAKAIENVLPHIDCIYDKSEENFFEGTVEQRFLKGNRNDDVVKENNLSFYVNWVEGQKTGFFNDQRESRKLLQQFAPSNKVVNLFSYSGGFSVYALNAKATLVHSVDSSKKAQEWANKNVELNGYVNHQFFCEDVFDFLKRSDENYDVWVVDPPAFAKHLDATAKAMIGYRNLNSAVFKKAKPGAVVFTFSCSQAIDRSLFRKIIFQSALQVNRQIKILHQLSQPADHPVSVYHPEGEYLKGLVLYVE
jgi:23S rRNA (cytosine1962-C5)-methyltransferase